MSRPRLPNLFIIGAPKCGTTAMSHYLAGHPDIYMSEEAGVKEPRFFCTDRLYTGGKHITEWNDYLELFAPAPSSVDYLGEATPRYLLSRRAVPAILEACPDPRFIVMLRDPVELAASQHNQKVREGVEDADFERAWRLQEERARGRSLPPGVKDGRVLQYARFAMLGSQLQRLYDTVERSRVHCIFHDDLGRDPARSYRRVLEFLRLPDDGRREFARRNSSVTYRSRRLERNLQRIRALRERLGLPGGLGIHAAINRVNRVRGRRQLRPEFKRELYGYFDDDIALLAELTGRDLSAWQRH